MTDNTEQNQSENTEPVAAANQPHSTASAASSGGDGPLISIWLRILGVIGIVFGLLLAIPGVQLIFLGGSWYYLIAGGATIAAGWFIFQGQPKGVLIYLGVCALAVVWGLAEVAGMQQWFWPLIPRLFAFAFALVFILLAVPLMPSVQGNADLVRKSQIGAAATVAVLVLTVIGMFQPHGVVREKFSPSPAASVMSATTAMGDEWRNYGGTTLGNRFQSAAQINRDTVKDLKVAWVYRTGKKGYDTNADQNTPIFADNTVYSCTYDNQVHAIDGETGERKWMFDPKASGPFFMRCRGVTYYKAPGPDDDGKCASRIILSTVDTRLFALDAETGEPCRYFGNNGVVDMKRGMGEFEPGMYGFTSAPTVAMDTIILGSFLNDNISVLEPSGVVRAMDAVTGELRWAFDVGRPGEKGWPKDGEIFTPGTPNVWTHPAVDEELGYVYLPTGNATPDVYGPNRRPFDNEYTASIIAVDIRTGDEVWKFQTVHRDLWDFDLPSQPSLY
ncbi:MAG: PQQ-binding-like beta-propeller repeat protein, partial [Parvularculaceae bacterium]|nr:PQQ-binding-like beta-propeller repeat protein [Parvularculaceae bacterium]